MKKRFNSPIYTKGKFGKLYRETINTDNECLYSHGIYPTKIKKEDLPEYYIEICSRTFWYLTAYLKTTGIIDIKYEMCKVNHMFKDDFLYISYHEPLQKGEIISGYISVVNYDVVICGGYIIPVLLAAEKYSNYDISEIHQQIDEKRIWYKEHYYDDYMREIGNKNEDLFELYGKYFK